MKFIVSIFCLLLTTATLLAQADFYDSYTFPRADTLRGALRPERSNYDVTFYELDIKVDVKKEYLSGYVDMHYTVLDDFKTLQIDLFDNMQINSINHRGRQLNYRREYNAVFVTFEDTQQRRSTGKIRINYEGAPVVARNAPWDGGFVWSKDKKGNPWVGVACEGDGASLWWPNKDHLSDEPDSMAIRIAVPQSLDCIANGDLRGTKNLSNGYRRYDWFVSYPINNYNVTVNIGRYAHFEDTYEAMDGDKLRLDYYVLAYNEEKAKLHFQQTQKVLACFERYFGKYPFWNDGFALVETPYLGMEHQGAIAYGNQYQRGYLGGMIPADMDWDYIIVHETGHEWFGNSISSNDLAEMWIHESFTTYMEALYVECAYSYKDAIRYLNSQRSFIRNEEPILGPKNVNWEDWGGSDHYFKGAWMLHTLRHAINDDEVWFDLLKSFHQKNAISNVTTEDFVQHVNRCTKQDYTAFFEQYLVYPDIPTLEYAIKKVDKNVLEVRYRWQADVTNFKMPVLMGKEGDYVQVFPITGEWRATRLEGLTSKDFQVARELFYINAKQMD